MFSWMFKIFIFSVSFLFSCLWVRYFVLCWVRKVDARQGVCISTVKVLASAQHNYVIIPSLSGVERLNKWTVQTSRLKWCSATNDNNKRITFNHWNVITLCAYVLFGRSVFSSYGSVTQTQLITQLSKWDDILNNYLHSFNNCIQLTYSTYNHIKLGFTK